MSVLKTFALEVNGFNLDDLTIHHADATELVAALEKALDRKKAERLGELKSEFVRQVEALGLSADAALESIKANGKENGYSSKTAGEPKYRNPDNPAQTWTGRGKKPAWAERHIDAGGNLDDLLIPAT